MNNKFYWILKKWYSLSFNISPEKEEYLVFKTLDEVTIKYFRSLLVKAMMYLKSEDTKKMQYIDIEFNVDIEKDICTYIIDDKNIIIKFTNNDTIKLVSLSLVVGGH